MRALEARLAKDRALKLAGEERREALSEAAAIYRRIYEAKPDYYPAINWASLAFLAGDSGEARRVAEIVLANPMVTAADDYWSLATRAEANLLLDRRDLALADLNEAAARSDAGARGAFEYAPAVSSHPRRDGSWRRRGCSAVGSARFAADASCRRRRTCRGSRARRCPSGSKRAYPGTDRRTAFRLWSSLRSGTPREILFARRRSLRERSSMSSSQPRNWWKQSGARLVRVGCAAFAPAAARRIASSPSPRTPPPMNLACRTMPSAWPWV